VPKSPHPGAPPGLDLLVAAGAFAGEAREIVHGLKFRRLLGLAERAAEAIDRAGGELLDGTVVPVPASPLRWRWRGFDPAEEIALALARRRGLTLSRCLRRRHGPRQVGRSRRERVGDPPEVQLRGRAPRNALLVDDVCTTGATLAACAASLRTGGCERVVAAVVARAL
jgi:predicted amidophosphoribosyltransferase